MRPRRRLVIWHLQVSDWSGPGRLEANLPFHLRKHLRTHCLQAWLDHRHRFSLKLGSKTWALLPLLLRSQLPVPYPA
jgi:hypothetical protein